MIASPRIYVAGHKDMEGSAVVRILQATYRHVASKSREQAVIITKHIKSSTSPSRRQCNPFLSKKYLPKSIWPQPKWAGSTRTDKPPKQMKLVHAWIAMHADALMDDLEMTSAGEATYEIDPLS
jgi:hypothetical protein